MVFLSVQVKPEEQIPSQGRLILLDADSFDLIQEYQVAGSLQAITTTNENKYLVLGINNQIEVYDFASMLPTFRNDQVLKKGKLDLMDRRISGTFIQSIVQLPQPKTNMQAH